MELILAREPCITRVHPPVAPLRGALAAVAFLFLLGKSFHISFVVVSWLAGWLNLNP
jgi:hypothetical protein